MQFGRISPGHTKTIESEPDQVLKKIQLKLSKHIILGGRPGLVRSQGMSLILKVFFISTIDMKTVSIEEVMQHIFINPKCLFDDVIVLF